MTIHRHLFDWLAPLSILLAVLALWQGAVQWLNTPAYILPGPVLIVQTLVADWPLLSSALWVTLTITMQALLAAVTGGVALALILSQSRWMARAIMPFAIILQVTPIIAIAPLLLVWLEPAMAVLVCAFLVAFFPVLSGMSSGLAATDHNLIALFELYHASRWKIFWLLRLPAALPYFFSGLRIAGGLALIGAVAAELAAGAAGAGSGLAFRITEAGFRLNIPRMFAALTLIAITGMIIFAAFSCLSWLALRRWHDTERNREH